MARNLKQLMKINRLERRLKKCLLDLQHNNILDQCTYESLRATGSNLGKLYGLPKST